MKFKDKFINALEDIVDLAFPAFVAVIIAGAAFVALALCLWIGLEIALAILEGITQAAERVIAAIKS